MEKTHIGNHFRVMMLLPATGTLKIQLKLIHKQSSVECMLTSDDVGLIKSTKIIQNYITIEPVCKRKSNARTHKLEIFLMKFYHFSFDYH